MAKAKATVSKVEKRIIDVDLKNLEIRSFDTDNLYPQRVIDIVNDSGTAKACVRVAKRFYVGGKFTNETLGKIRVNRHGLTADKLLDKIANSLIYFGGACLHFNYNALGQKTEINFIPFEYARLTLDGGKYPDRVAIYDDFGKTLRKNLDSKLIKYVHKYDPKKVLEQVALEAGETIEEKFGAYNGQVLYWTPEGDDAHILCPFDAVLEDMITEAQTKRFKTNSSARNFMASHIVVTGKSEVELDQDGNPIENNEGGIGETLKQFQGGEGTGLMLHIEKESEDEPFELIPVEIQKYDGLYQFTEDSATEDIVRAFNIPDILVLRREGGLGGNGAELYEAKQYYNDVTQYDRDTITKILEEAFEGFIGGEGVTDFSIIPLQYKKPISQEYFPYYSKNEIRKSNGDAEIEEVSADAKILAVELGVGGTQSLTGIIVDPALTVEQKKGTIKVLFGLQEAEINAMLGIITEP